MSPYPTTRVIPKENNLKTKEIGQNCSFGHVLVDPSSSVRTLYASNQDVRQTQRNNPQRNNQLK